MNDISGTIIPSASHLGTEKLAKSVRYLLLLLAAGFAWRAFFMFRDVPWLTNFWLFEDFGYSLKIAKNIALGLGETFDGVVPTNGYQPLYVWLMVPVFWVIKTDLLAPVYVAMILLALANVATGVFIFAIVRRLTGQATLALLGTAFWMFNFAVAKDGTNGLEAGLSTMMVAACLHYYLKYHHNGMPLWRAVVLGLLLGLAFLARVDAIFLAAGVFFCMFFDRTMRAKERLLLLVLAGSAFLVVVLPYAGWNLVHFGSPLPTSGQVTTGKTSVFALAGTPFSKLASQFEFGCYIVLRMLAGAPSVNGWVPPPQAASATAAAVIVLALVGAGLWILVAKTKPLTLARKAALVLGLTAALYMYGYTIHSFVSFERYFLPVVLVLTLLLPIAAHALVPLARDTTVKRWVVVLSCLGAAYYVNAGMAYLAAPGDKPIGWYAGVEKLNRLSRPGDVVAAMQTGNTGYFYTNGRAINLDGVVNIGVYHIRKQGDIDDYLRQQHVKYLADEPGWIHHLVNSVADNARRERLKASLMLRYRSPEALYEIYELSPEVYTAVQKIDGPGWSRREKAELFGGYATFAATPGARLDFSSSGCFALKFLKHGWSGKVDVLKDGMPLTAVDLYAPTEDETFRIAFQQDASPHTYSLVVSQDKNAQSQGHEVWFDAVLNQPGCGAGTAQPH